MASSLPVTAYLGNVGSLLVNHNAGLSFAAPDAGKMAGKKSHSTQPRTVGIIQPVVQRAALGSSGLTVTHSKQGILSVK